jgi:predicted DNA-binding transcriptional regulator AlpA
MMRCQLYKDYMNMQNTLNPSLAQFDQLADSAMIRPKPSAQFLGISIATLWRLIRQGHIKTIKLTERTTAIKVGDLRAFIASREAI